MLRPVEHDKGLMSLHQTFENWATTAPDQMAVVSGDQSLTYKELDLAASRLAGRLRTLGAVRDKIIGLYFDRSLELIVAMLAVLKAGAAYLPLDRALPGSRLFFMLQEVESPLLLTQAHLEPEAPGGAAQTLLIDLDDLKRQPQQNVTLDRPDPSTLAYVIYTSGSTGKPKGVLIEHRSVSNYIAAVIDRYGVQPKDRVLQLSSLSFDASVEEIFIALCAGATLVLRDDAMISSVATFLQKCSEHQISVVGCPTAFWHELVNLIEEQDLAIPRTLRAVIIGGEQASAERLKIWQKHARAQVRLFNTYGPTETTIAATMFSVPKDWQRDYLPIGRAISGMKIRVLDAELQEVGSGKEGELYIGGTGVARGYLKRPELTAQKFIPDPDNANNRLYKTGDLVRQLADGNLVFLGRIDQQVKIGGFRVELGEIEAALEKNPNVRQAVVLAREDKHGPKQLVAYLVTSSEVTPEELRQYLSQHLPHYMVPVRFMFLDKLPVTANGKIDRRALPPPAEQLKVGAAPREWTPRNPIELKLQVTFARFFNRTDIRPETSFFELGGDSLQALRLIVELERALDKKLPLGILYKASTVRELATEIAKESVEAEHSALVPLQPHGSRKPFFLVHTTPGDVLGYGNLVYHLNPQQPCYAFQSVGLFAPEKAHQTIEEMAAHYNRLMRAVQPNGPYSLGGWCYGGIVAMEMAQQLKLAGEDVALLALMETPAPPPVAHRWQYHFDRLSKLVLRSPGEFWKYLGAKLNYYRNRNEAYELRFKETGNRWHGEDQSYYEKLRFLYDCNMDAVNKHRSCWYDGRVLLLNAVERDPAIFPDPYFGWGSLVSQIELHTIPGKHDTILMEPYVSELAEVLESYLLQSNVPTDALDEASSEERQFGAQDVFNQKQSTPIPVS